VKADVAVLAGHSGRFFTLLLTVSLLAAVSACERQQSGAPGESVAAGAPDPHEIASRLIKRTIADPEDGHVAIEIDDELLRGINAGADNGTVMAAFRDPLLAAWLFAPSIGVPTDAMISIERVSEEAEEASGLFIAVAVANTGTGSIRMRLVSEPGLDGLPFLWMLNDYDLEPGNGAAGAAIETN